MSSPYPHIKQFEQLTLEQERTAQLQRELEAARPPRERARRRRLFGLRRPVPAPC
jgi:hypothetical protein